MLKLSFKDGEKTPSKYVEKFGKYTAVILTGDVKMPEFWYSVPDSVYKDTFRITNVSVVKKDSSWIVATKGTARCHPEDKYDSMLGEKLAESRAKQKLYKFIYLLASKTYNYYNSILFGNGGATVSNSTSDSLEGCVNKYKMLYEHELHYQKKLLKSNKDG